MYCRGASVALLVFDLSDEQSFVQLDPWFDQVKATAPPGCEVIVIGNKLDLPSAIPDERINAWIAKHRVKYFAVSALEGTGIQELFHEVSNSLVERVSTPRIEEIENEASEQNCC
jgi:GTPase SAR1 family protein